MSYNLLENETDDLTIIYGPLINGERCPPPPNAVTTVRWPIMERNQDIIHNDSTHEAMVAPKDENNPNFAFNDQSIRKGFIRKVYGILLVQLLITCGIVAVFIYHDPTKYFVLKNPVVLVAAVVVNVVVIFSLAVCESARRSFPINFVCLGFFTITISLLLGTVASITDANEILLAGGITGVLVLGLTIYAMQTKYDFDAWGGVLISILLCFLVTSIVVCCAPPMLEQMSISSLGAVLACFLLIYDTQLIVGGNHTYQFSPEDYIFAVLTLYVDILLTTIEGYRAHMEYSNKIHNGQDIAIQCELLIEKRHAHGYTIYEFDIADYEIRRGLVRRFYGLLIISLCIPCLEILLAFPLPYIDIVKLIVPIFNLLLYTCLYICRNWRRSPPYSYIVFLLTTFCGILGRCLYVVTLNDTHWIQLYPVALIFELIALMLYTKQHKCKFTQAQGVLVVSITFCFFLLIGYKFNLMMTVLAVAVCVLEAWYVVYDTHCMLCGRHGYNLKSHEYIYAACNIYADIPKCLWALTKALLLSQVIGVFRFCRDCCHTEVC